MNPVINNSTKNKNQLHRTDGPTIEYPNGTKSWYLNGKLHRTDGPAFEGSNGYKRWFLNGVLHRTDGPAVEYPNGKTFWYLNGKELSKDLFLKLTGPVMDLPLYLGLGFDQFISERIKNEPGHKFISQVYICKVGE